MVSVDGAAEHGSADRWHGEPSIEDLLREPFRTDWWHHVTDNVSLWRWTSPKGRLSESLRSFILFFINIVLMIVILNLLCSEFVELLQILITHRSRSKRRSSFQQTRSQVSLKLLSFWFFEPWTIYSISFWCWLYCIGLANDVNFFLFTYLIKDNLMYSIIIIIYTRVATHLARSDTPNITCVVARLSRSDTPTMLWRSSDQWQGSSRRSRAPAAGLAREVSS